MFLPLINLTQIGFLGWLAFSHDAVMCHHEKFPMVSFEIDSMIPNTNTSERGPVGFSWTDGSPIAVEPWTSNFGIATNSTTSISLTTASWHIGISDFVVRLWMFCNECQISNSLGMSRYLRHEWKEIVFVLPDWILQDVFTIKGELPILLQGLAASQ